MKTVQFLFCHTEETGLTSYFKTIHYITCNIEDRSPITEAILLSYLLSSVLVKMFGPEK